MKTPTTFPNSTMKRLCTLAVALLLAPCAALHAAAPGHGQYSDVGKLIDARALPHEKEVDDFDPAAAVAKMTLQTVFKTIRRDGPKPPVSFLNAEN
jgi:hypothetical protein